MAKWDLLRRAVGHSCVPLRRQHAARSRQSAPTGGAIFRLLRSPPRPGCSGCMMPTSQWEALSMANALLIADRLLSPEEVGPGRGGSGA